MQNILSKITNAKRSGLKLLKKRVPLKLLLALLDSAPAPLSLADTLKRKGVSIIAEVKQASPSKGLITKDFKPVETALAYEKYGASAVSVLTEEAFFLGNLGYLAAIKGKIRLPVLRKDFLVDEYQLYEARAAGADAVLLITACLSPSMLRAFLKTASRLGMDALVEVHTPSEARTALSCDARLIGINNRNLRDFSVDLRTTSKIKELLPREVLTVSESGIRTQNDIKYLNELGVNGALIGEALMRSFDIGKTLGRLL